MTCLLTDKPEVQAQLDQYTDIFNSNDVAYYVLSENNGFGLDRTPSGVPSKLFSDLLRYYDGDLNTAILMKSKIFTKRFKNTYGDWLNNPVDSTLLDSNGEPLLNTVLTGSRVIKFNQLAGEPISNSVQLLSAIESYLPSNPLLSKLLGIFKATNVKVEVVDSIVENGKKVYMSYNGDTNAIEISKTEFDKCSITYNATSVMHEMVHVFTARSIHNVEEGRGTEQEIKLYNSIKKLYNFYKEQYLDKVNEDGEYVGKYYGFTSEYEFVAELMTNQDFFNVLVDASNNAGDSVLSKLWNNLKELWHNILYALGLTDPDINELQNEIFDFMEFNILNQNATEEDIYQQSTRNNALILYNQTQYASKYKFNTKEELDSRLKDVRQKLTENLESRLKAIQRDDSVSFEAKEEVKYQLRNLRDNTVDTFKVLSDVTRELARDVVQVSRTVLDAYKGNTNVLSDDKLVSLNKNYFGFYTKYVNDLYDNLVDIDEYAEMIGPDNYRTLMRQLALCKDILNRCSDHLKRMQVENAKQAMLQAGIQGKSPTIHTYLEENSKETNYDISYISRLLFSADRMNDEALKSLFNIVQEAENKVNHNTANIANRLLTLLKQANNRQKDLFEVDEHGKPTGYIIRDLLYGKMYRDYRNALKQIRADLGIANTDLSLPENRELRIEFNKRKDKWLSEHVERKYTDEYYAYFRELSQEATDAREAIMFKIRSLQDKYRGKDGIVKYEKFSNEDYNTLLGYYVEKKALASRYYADGTEKLEGSVDRRIADELSALNEKLSKGLKMKSNKQKFEEVRRQKELEYGANSKEYKTWIARNTRVVLSEEFYNLLSQIERETYPDTNYAELQEQKRQILNIYRDPFTGEINAKLMPMATKNLINRIDNQLRSIRKKNKAKPSKTGLKFKDIAKIVSTEKYKEDRSEAMASDIDSPGTLEAFDAINSIRDQYGNFIPRSYYSKVIPLNSDYISIEPSIEFGEMSDESPFYNKNYDRSNPEYYQPKRKLYDNSKAYNKVMKDENLRNLRQGIIDTIHESNSKLTNRTGLNDYKLPQISGSTYRYVKSRGFFKGMKGWVLDAVSRQNDDVGIRDKVVTAPDGTALEMIPQYFLKDLEDPSTITADMVGATISYYRMAENFKQKSAIRAKVENIKQFLRERYYTGSGITIKDKLQNVFKQNREPRQGSETNIYKFAEKFINMNIYDVQTNSISRTIMGREVNISKLLLMAKSMGTTINLGANFACAFTGFFTAMHAHLSNIISGRYYDFPTALHAFADMIYDLFRHGINNVANSNYKSQQMALMDYFQVGSTMDSLWQHSNRPKWINAITRHWAFGVYSFSDYFIKGQILNSVMYNYKNVDGHFISKEEFFRKNGYNDKAKDKWSKAKSFKASIKMIGGILQAINSKDQKAVDEIKFTIGNTARTLAASADGQLTSLQKAQFSANAFGAICMMHRNYIPALLQERLTMKRQWDYTSQREVEALLQTPLRILAQVKKDHYTAKALKNAFKEITGFSQDPLTRSNIRKLIFETTMVFGLYPFIAAISNASADDDKDNKLKNLFAYVMLRTAFETRSAYTLIDIYSTIKQPTPLYSLFDNIGTLVWQSILPVTSLMVPYLYDSEDIGKEITRGAYKGCTQFERALWKLTPFKNVKELNDIPSKRRYYETQIMN